MRFGIRHRLLLPLALLMLGVVGAALWSARISARRAEERIAAHVREVSQTLAAADYPLTGRVLVQVKSYSGADFVFITPEEARITTFVSPNVELPTDSAFEEFQGHSIGPITHADGIQFRCRRLILKEPHRQAGGVVYIFYPESLLAEAIADAERPSFLALLIGLVAVGITVGIGQRLVFRIRDLEKRTRQIAEGDFSPMPLPRANDELRDLSASVNEMAGRLDRLQKASERAERSRLTAQLATGLAHQLRNGVTGAKLAVQVHLEEHPDEDTEALDVTLRQLAMMDANLRRFIDLGRSAESKRERCSLNRIVAGAIELFRPRCEHASIKLEASLSERDSVVEGDPGQLSDIFVNLIGNAIDAVGSSGEVRITLEERDGRAIVDVLDTGTGPDADLAGRLFEPFVTGKPEGIGLGLAVAKHAAEAHGGSIEWERVGTQTRFRVRLPIGTPGGV